MCGYNAIWQCYVPTNEHLPAMYLPDAMCLLNDMLAMYLLNAMYLPSKLTPAMHLLNALNIVSHPMYDTSLLTPDAWCLLYLVPSLRYTYTK